MSTLYIYAKMYMPAKKHIRKPPEKYSKSIKRGNTSIDEKSSDLVWLYFSLRDG